MKFDFVEGSGGSVAEINVPVWDAPFGSDLVFHVPENPEQDRFGDEMFVGLARKLGQVVRIRHLLNLHEDFHRLAVKGRSGGCEETAGGPLDPGRLEVRQEARNLTSERGDFSNSPRWKIRFLTE